MYGLIPVHIAAASIALVSGAIALAFAKGTVLHRRAGRIFAVSMLAMFLTAVVIGALKSRPNLVLVMSSIVGGYLVATSWATARRRSGEAGRFELWALGVILACMAAYAFFSIKAAISPTGRFAGLGQAIILPNLAIATLAASLDLNFILRRRLLPRQRLARHVWRMCAGLFIVTAAFLGDGQGQSPIPGFIREAPILLAAPAAVILAMIFWLLRLRFPGRYSRSRQWVARLFARGGEPARANPLLFGEPLLTAPPSTGETVEFQEKKP